jgi:AcrR family transcriptional regulator
MAEGLREQKKRELRVRLSRAAAELARQHGVHNVRVEDIVERVGVSRRTFSNYFANKEEAIVDRHLQRAEDTARILRRRPPDEPLWDALTAAVLQPFATADTDYDSPLTEDREALAAVLSAPELQAAIVRGSRAAIRELAAAIGERSGIDPHRHFYPALIANAVLTTELLTLEFWLGTEPPVALLPLLKDAFHQLGAGLSAPVPTTTL